MKIKHALLALTLLAGSVHADDIQILAASIDGNSIAIDNLKAQTDRDRAEMHSAGQLAVKNADELTVVNAKITGIQSHESIIMGAVNANKGGLNALSQRMSVAETKIDGSQAATVQLNKDLNLLRSDVADHDKRISALESLPVPRDGKDGLNGVDGKDGKDGLNGKDGADGKDGLNGHDGKDGINGKDGSDGAKGAAGADGKNGLDGKDGANGKDGVDGRNGVDGKNGTDGINGKDGKDGINGHDGAAGADGKDGHDGVDGKQGPAGRDGLNGANGKDGKDGLNGTNGKDGAKGDTGAAGKDGHNGATGKKGAAGKDFDSKPVNARIDHLSKRVDNLDHRINRVGSLSMASSSLHFNNNHSGYAMALGQYRDSVAIAGGLQFNITEHSAATIQATYDGQDVAVGAGVHGDF